MVFPTGGRAIVNLLYAGVNPQDDGARRVAIQRTGEQFAHTFGAQWGNKKRAGLGDDFRSPDSLAYQHPDGTVDVWDIQASSGAILVADGKPADHPGLSPGEATFMPCEPKNHLDITPDPGTPPPNPGTPPPAVDLRELRMMLTDALVSLEELKETVGMLSGLVASLQMRHDPMPKLLELQEELRTLEVRGGNRPFTTMTLGNVRK